MNGKWKWNDTIDLSIAMQNTLQQNINFNNQLYSINNGTFYDLMKNKYNHPIAYVDRSIEAKNATIEIASLLHIKKGAAIYTVTTVAYDENDVPVEYSEAFYECFYTMEQIKQMLEKAGFSVEAVRVV